MLKLNHTVFVAAREFDLASFMDDVRNNKTSVLTTAGKSSNQRSRELNSGMERLIFFF